MASMISQLPLLEDLGYSAKCCLDHAFQTEEALTAFAACFSRATNLKHLRVQGWQQAPALVDAVASNLLDLGNLQTVETSHEGNSNRDAMMLCMQLANLRALDTVSIRRNALSHEALVALGQSLESLLKVQVLSVAQCSSSTEGFAMLFQHLSTVTSIEHLDLTWNKFKSEMPGSVAQQLGLGTLTALRSISLGYLEMGNERL